MSLLPELPEKLVNYLFNLERGEPQQKFCRSCDKITPQVTISFSDTPLFRDNEVQRFAGRLLDIVPGMPLFTGKPTVCKCKTVNR
jgi:hypothetical protein